MSCFKTLVCVCYSTRAGVTNKQSLAILSDGSHSQRVGSQVHIGSYLYVCVYRWYRQAAALGQKLMAGCLVALRSVIHQPRSDFSRLSKRQAIKKRIRPSNKLLYHMRSITKRQARILENRKWASMVPCYINQK